MRNRGIAAVLATFAVAIAAPAVARADAGGDKAKPTFEQVAKGAVRVDRAGVTGLLWAAAASCDGAGDDLDQRQCRAIKAARADEVAAQTYIVPGDAAAFVVGVYDAKKKSIPLTLSGCVACVEPLSLGGKAYYVVSNKGAPTFQGKLAHAAVLHETSRSFTDEQTALDWRAKVVPRLRTEFVVRLAAGGAVWNRDGKDGVAVEVLGFRVYDPCDGAIVCASPSSAKAAVDKAACGGAVVEGEPDDADDADDGAKADAPKAEKLPDEITSRQIQTAMQPVRDAAEACYQTYGVPGDGKLKVTVSGGAVIALEWTKGELADTPTGACIEKAAREVTFPKTRKSRQSFTYPISLR
ncbi:MAG: hypothetical protein H6709_08620 [Kofleriaceae bacterium]|nr:hypothetical protein [Kofleriaceae bacterium]